jgi:hypothetical protein
MGISLNSCVNDRNSCALPDLPRLLSLANRFLCRGLIEIHAAVRAVIGCWPLSHGRSGGGTHPNSTFRAACESHTNDDGRPGKHGKYEQCEEPKHRGPMDKADPHADAACSNNDAKPRESLPQTVSNRHVPPSCHLALIGRARDADACSTLVPVSTRAASRHRLLSGSLVDWLTDSVIRRCLCSVQPCLLIES